MLVTLTTGRLILVGKNWDLFQSKLKVKSEILLVLIYCSVFAEGFSSNFLFFIYLFMYTGVL